MANVYCSSARHAAVAQWAAATVYSAASNGGRGDYVRQLAVPAAGSERVMRCTTGGTSAGAEPAAFATATKNQVIADNTVNWTECTGQEADQVAGTWKAPHAKKQGALAATWFAAGDTLYTGNDHAETQAAAVTITYPGTIATPDRDICVLVTGSVPPVEADIRATASVTTTGTNSLTIQGCAYVEGTTYNGGTTGASAVNAGGAVQTDLILKNCGLWPLSAAGGFLQLGSSNNNIGTRLKLNNTTYKVGAASATMQICGGVQLLWENTPALIQGATIPTTFISAQAANGCEALWDGCDLSALSTKTFIGAISKGGQYTFKNCTLPAAYTLLTAPTSAAVETYVINCAATGISYVGEKHDVRGDQTMDATVTRTGALAVNGTIVSSKIIGTASAKFQCPFESYPFLVNNAVVGSAVTLTFYGTWSGGALPNNDQVWAEAVYMGALGSPIATFKDNTKATILAAAAAQTADGSAWSGGTTNFKLVLVLNAPAPQLVGPIYVKIKCATTNTVWIDPTGIAS